MSLLPMSVLVLSLGLYVFAAYVSISFKSGAIRLCFAFLLAGPFNCHLQVSAILTSFLSHLHKDKVLRLKHGGRVCRFLLSHWSSMASWWGSSSTVDQKLAAIAVLKKMLATDQDVCIRKISCLLRCFVVFHFELLL